MGTTDIKLKVGDLIYLERLKQYMKVDKNYLNREIPGPEWTKYLQDGELLITGEEKKIVLKLLRN